MYVYILMIISMEQDYDDHNVYIKDGTGKNNNS